MGYEKSCPNCGGDDYYEDLDGVLECFDCGWQSGWEEE